MIRYAKVINENTKECNVGLGNDTQYYLSLGMTQLDVEQAYDGKWYLINYIPVTPEIIELQQELTKKEIAYNMPRVIREGILGNPSMYSEFNVNRARDLEELAKKVRDLKEGN